MFSSPFPSLSSSRRVVFWAIGILTVMGIFNWNGQQTEDSDRQTRNIKEKYHNNIQLQTLTKDIIGKTNSPIEYSPPSESPSVSVSLSASESVTVGGIFNFSFVECCCDPYEFFAFLHGTPSSLSPPSPSQCCFPLRWFCIADRSGEISAAIGSGEQKFPKNFRNSPNPKFPKFPLRKDKNSKSPKSLFSAHFLNSLIPKGVTERAFHHFSEIHKNSHGEGNVNFKWKSNGKSPVKWSSDFSFEMNGEGGEGRGGKHFIEFPSMGNDFKKHLISHREKERGKTLREIWGNDTVKYNEEIKEKSLHLRVKSLLPFADIPPPFPLFLKDKNGGFVQKNYRVVPEDPLKYLRIPTDIFPEDKVNPSAPMAAFLSESVTCIKGAEKTGTTWMEEIGRFVLSEGCEILNGLIDWTLRNVTNGDDSLSPFLLYHCEFSVGEPDLFNLIFRPKSWKFQRIFQIGAIADDDKKHFWKKMEGTVTLSVESPDEIIKFSQFQSEEKSFVPMALSIVITPRQFADSFGRLRGCAKHGNLNIDETEVITWRDPRDTALSRMWFGRTFNAGNIKEILPKHRKHNESLVNSLIKDSPNELYSQQLHFSPSLRSIYLSFVNRSVSHHRESFGILPFYRHPTAFLRYESRVENPSESIETLSVVSKVHFLMKSLWEEMSAVANYAESKGGKIQKIPPFDFWNSKFIEKILSLSSFNSLKERENKNQLEGPRIPESQRLPIHRKIRMGKSGQFKTQIPQDVIDSANQIIKTEKITEFLYLQDEGKSTLRERRDMI